MTEKKNAILSQVKALKKTDLSPFIRMSGMMAPRALNAFLPNLTDRQRNAFDKVMPQGGEKKLYVQLQGSPTPPVVIEIAQPLKICTVSESEISQQQIKGLKVNVDDLPILAERRIGKFLWRNKEQLGTMLSFVGMFAPLILLGPRELKDMQNKAMKHFKPLFDLMPRQ